MTRLHPVWLSSTQCIFKVTNVTVKTEEPLMVSGSTVQRTLVLIECEKASYEMRLFAESETPIPIEIKEGTGQ